MKNLWLPPEIERKVNGLPYAENTTGMSGAGVFMFFHADGASVTSCSHGDMVLKIQPAAPWTEREVTMLRWLAGKVPAPEVIACEERDGKIYLLMTRVKGKMACDEEFLARPEMLILRLAEAMHMLWDADVSSCPVMRDQETELAEARFRVEHGLVDTDNVEPTTFGPGGFKDPEALLYWLENNRPPFDPVLSHGDFCLPNVFFTETGIGGFIDLGDAGVGDRWRDIALCHRSLRHNMEGKYASVKRKADADRFFGALGVAPDPEKLRWYLLLDELF